MKRLAPSALFVLALGLVAPLSAQVGGDGDGARAQSARAQMNRTWDLDGDGKITDDEVERVIRWELLNPEYKLSKKDRKAREQRLAAEKKAEIAKWDLNGDGKLDEAENKRRLEAYERLAKAQKKSREQAALDKPIMSYLGK